MCVCALQEDEAWLLQHRPLLHSVNAGVKFATMPAIVGDAASSLLQLSPEELEDMQQQVRGRGSRTVRVRMAVRHTIPKTHTEDPNKFCVICCT